jgi:hypothetical protein
MGGLHSKYKYTVPLLAEPNETRSTKTPECEYWHFARAPAQQLPRGAALKQAQRSVAETA